MIKKTTALAAIIALFALAVFWLVPPIPQPQEYHRFADQRSIFGISNFWNVLSNVPFLFVGVMGLYYLRHGRLMTTWQPGYPAPIWFFVGVLLTAFGSGWYHLNPSDGTLVWDRVPMTLSFMPLFIILLSDYLSPGIEERLLYPLLVIGVCSVVYWYVTELLGQGDLRWYGLVQFLPMLLMVPLVLFSGARYSHGHLYLWMFGFYLLAKIAEFYDRQIFQLSDEWMSGHVLKHLLAATAAATVLVMLKKRRLLVK